MEQATCPGGAEIVLNKGLWRNMSDESKFIKLYNCLNEKACPGGKQSECSVGYQGIFCSRCIDSLNNKTYARSQGYQCLECSPLRLQLGLFSLAMILRFGWIIYILYNLFQNPQRNKPQTVLIRIFTNYIQVISLVASFELEWPSQVNFFLGILAKITDSQDSFYSFECIFKQLGLKEKFHFISSTYYVQVVTMGITPLIVSILSIPFWLLVYFLCSRKSKAPITDSNLPSNNTDGNPCDNHLSSQKLPQKSTTFDYTNREGSLSIMNVSERGNLQSQPNRNTEHRLSLDNSNAYSSKQSKKKPYEEQKKGTLFSKDHGVKMVVKKKDDDLTKANISKSHLIDQTNNIAGEQSESCDDIANGEVSGPDIKRIEEENTEATLIQKLWATFFVIELLWHPSIINYSFSLFTCIHYEDGFSYLKKDTEIQCWQGANFILQLSIGSSLILVWAIIFPITIFWLINKEKNRLGEVRNLKLYGIFYVGLNDDSFYWEIIVMNIRKLGIIVAATFIDNNQSNLKGYIGILVLFIHRHFSHYQMPFIDPRFNIIENWSSFASMCTIFGGLILLPSSERDDELGFRNEIDREMYKTIILVFVSLVNLYFLALWFYYFLSVLIRLNFALLKRIFNCLRIDIADIDDYETNLSEWRQTNMMAANFPSAVTVDKQSKFDVIQSTKPAKKQIENQLQNKGNDHLVNVSHSERRLIDQSINEDEFSLEQSLDEHERPSMKRAAPESFIEEKLKLDHKWTKSPITKKKDNKQSSLGNNNLNLKSQVQNNSQLLITSNSGQVSISSHLSSLNCSKSSNQKSDSGYSIQVINKQSNQYLTSEFNQKQKSSMNNSNQQFQEIYHINIIEALSSNASGRPLNDSSITHSSVNIQ